MIVPVDRRAIRDRVRVFVGCSDARLTGRTRFGLPVVRPRTNSLGMFCSARACLDEADDSSPMPQGASAEFEVRAGYRFAFGGPPGSVVATVLGKRANVPRRTALYSWW